MLANNVLSAADSQRVRMALCQPIEVGEEPRGLLFVERRGSPHWTTRVEPIDRGWFEHYDHGQVKVADRRLNRLWFRHQEKTAGLERGLKRGGKPARE